ncbi:MAG: PTS mannose transporter subunit IIAB [Candidatus Eisenbacteria sp.]|nr:PTS mannose transporter subunit IIAB [Candidatus Eisenbacteria bacterium]
MTPGARISGVLVTHGALGAELLKTAESILGPQDDIAVLSNAGKPLDLLQAELEGLMQGMHPRVLFVDLLGGSCGHVCALMQRRFPRLLLATGVNLPMLLEFLHHRERVPPADLKQRLLERGRDGIRCLGWESGEEA